MDDWKRAGKTDEKKNAMTRYDSIKSSLYS